MKHPKSTLPCLSCGRTMPRESFLWHDRPNRPGQKRGKRCAECRAAKPNRVPRPLPALVENPDDPTTLLVPLTHGQFAVIDREDAALVEGRYWQASRSRWTWYAISMERAEVGKQRPVRMHRVILGLPDGVLVDHRDGDGLNNRRSNLRAATEVDNRRNSRLRRDNTSGYKGVSWHAGRRKWVAAVASRTVGAFDDPRDAARAYDEAARKQFGEFARTNFSEH